MKRILLVQAAADLDMSVWISKSLTGIKYARAYAAPLGLATVAAATPGHYEVQIWDELVQGHAEDNLDSGYDLVAISSFTKDIDRAKEIARQFRERGIPVVIGGPAATDMPEALAPHFDVVFVGEGEETWPKFLEEFEAGKHATRYQGSGRLDLALSPAPRWDSIAALMPDNYKMGGVQTTNGCPHTCEFCNVWIQFGRNIRTKPIDNVLAELRTLEAIGMRRVMLCSDNLIGNKRYARDLMRAVVQLNASFKSPLRFSAEVTIDVANDDEMLRLMAEANLNSVIIGVESVNVESLKETRKRQNLRGDTVEQLRRIASYGVAVNGSLIVGFDNDGPEAFDAQFRLIQDALVVMPRLNVLKANEGTDLYDRILADRRMIDLERSFPGQVPTDRSASSNIVPTKMTRAELFAGFLELNERVRDWGNFRERMIGYIDNLLPEAQRPEDPRLREVVTNLRASFHRIDGVDHACVDDILDHAIARAPGIAWEVATMIVAQIFERAELVPLREALQRQMELEAKLERRGGLVMLEPPPGWVPKDRSRKASSTKLVGLAA